MIFGVGVDLLAISRMRRLMEKHRSTLPRLFGDRELKLLAQNNRAESYAAHFCAKEAFAKALGTGLRGFSLNEVEVLRDTMGKPFFVLSGRALALAEGLDIFVSLTHDGGQAAAFVVAERSEKP